jgi:L-ascorbate metabolism protein UlaG (beta-lactamase superfamily)
MRVEWHGQSAFALSTASTSVFIDPFGDMSPLAERGMQFDYPAITGVGADLLLVTHEHLDHNGVEAISGDPQLIRSTAGRFESPIGEVVAIASEHDRAAGTERGPNSIVGFELVDQLRPRWVVPMHYRTRRIAFLQTADAFLELFPNVHRLEGTNFETAELPANGQPVAVVPAAP